MNGSGPGSGAALAAGAAGVGRHPSNAVDIRSIACGKDHTLLLTGARLILPPLAVGRSTISRSHVPSICCRCWCHLRVGR